MIITPKAIAYAESLGACEEALWWLRENPRKPISVERLVSERLEWALWFLSAANPVAYKFALKSTLDRLAHHDTSPKDFEDEITKILERLES